MKKPPGPLLTSVCNKMFCFRSNGTFPSQAKQIRVCFGFARNKHLNLGQADPRKFFPCFPPPDFCVPGVCCCVSGSLKTLSSNLLCLLDFWLVTSPCRDFLLLLLKAAALKSVLLWCTYFGIVCSMFCQSLCSSAGACKCSGDVRTQTSLFSLAL